MRCLELLKQCQAAHVRQLTVKERQIHLRAQGFPGVTAIHGSKNLVACFPKRLDKDQVIKTIILNNQDLRNLTSLMLWRA